MHDPSRDVAATKRTTQQSEQHQIRATRRLPHSRRPNNTMRGGLLLPPLDSTSHVYARGPRHTRHITLRPRSISEVAVRVVSKDALLPRVSNKPPCHRRSFDFASLLYPHI